MARVLILRPEPGATATIERVLKRGLEAVALPLFDIERVEWTAPEAGGFDGLLLTSANAVRCAGGQLTELRGLPAYAVGAATAQAARDAGFDVASTGEAGVDRLLGSLAAELKLLHLAGEDRRTPSDARQDITAVTVYRSTAKEGVDLAPASNSVALIHSLRAARRFAELADGAGIDKHTIRIAAISSEAAQAAGGGWAAVEAADEPSDDALLALTERLCNNSGRT
jgi:uroporphyrinogen-III synthase